MRLIAGEAKGRRLHVPRGLRVRPSGARWRESAFGILDHRNAISEGRVLDLFAGSGALGLEALSRGAARLVAVEKDRSVARVLSENAEHCGFGDRVEVRVQPALAALEEMGRTGVSFDLVLLDPPYRRGVIPEVLERLATLELVAPGGRILVEHPRDESVVAPAGWAIELERRFGDSRLTLLHRSGPED